MHGHADSPSLVHDVDLLALKRHMQPRALLVFERDNPRRIFRPPLAKRLQAEPAQSGVDLLRERIRVRGDPLQADGFQIRKRRTQRVQLDEIRHPYGKTRRARLGDGPLESVGVKRVEQMEPTAGMRSEAVCGR